MIKTLTISDFRNHESSRIMANVAKAVIITGPNGSGKTSILEAISTLSAGAGLRGASVGELLRNSPTQSIEQRAESREWGVVAELDDDTNVSVSWRDGDTYRRATIDGDGAPLSDLAKVLRMVWVTPREDRLFCDGASDRRAFFDRLAANFDPSHMGRAARLSKLLSERAFALKSWLAARSPQGEVWMDGIDKQIAQTAVSVAAARIKYIGEINYFLQDARYSLTIAGCLEEKLAAGMAAADAEREYLEYLSGARTLCGDKMTIDGAHKSDFVMFNGMLGMNVQMTSTGQQKSALLSLVIAHAKLVRARTGARPVILLDEAAAHLDVAARENLFAELAAADSQVWATGIDKGLFNGIDGAVFVACENGRIVEQ
ncbi:MAG: AAA family ATPase [Alphaproteobacteria bacterium]|nr:AAA family ATPase [Alphaproteobacteria bacterium]